MASNAAPSSPLERELQRAVAPMHKLALGVAVGLTAGVGLFVLTAFHIVAAPSEAAPLDLLSQYFFGYRVDWPGALIGAWWAGVVGFVAGWFCAFVRNVAMAAWLLSKRARAELFELRGFLDQI